MPYAKIRGATSGLDVVARTIAVPHDHKPLRMPSFPALERTSTLAFTDSFTLGITASAKSYVFIARDPAFPLWGRKALHTAAAAVFSNLLGSTVQTAIAASTTTLLISPIDGVASVNGAGVPTNLSGLPSGFIPIIQMRHEYFMPNLTGYYAIQLNTSGDLGVTNMTVSCEYIDVNRDVVSVAFRAAMTTSGTAAGMTLVPPAGTIGVRVTALSVEPTATRQVTAVHFGCAPGAAALANPLTGPTDVPVVATLPLVAPVEVPASSVPWQSTRVTACAALFTNVTAVLNKEGTVLAARLPMESSSFGDVTGWELAISKAHPKDRYWGAMENGLYTFTLPEQDSDKFEETLPFGGTPFSPSNSGPGSFSAIFNLDKCTYFHPIVFADIDATATTTLAVTLDRHIEFRTSSLLFPLGFSTHPLESYHVAQMALVQLGVFFENPLHLSAITSLVAAAVRKFGPIVAPYAVGAAKAIGGKLLEMGKNKVNSMAQKGFAPSKPKPKPPPSKPKNIPAGKRVRPRNARR